MSKLRILVAPSEIHGLGSEQVADCIEKVIKDDSPEDIALIRKIPLRDDDDFLKSFLALHNCELYPVVVNGLFCSPVVSGFWLNDDGNIAILDLKSVAGPDQIPDDCLDPTATTSYGVGELISAALDVGCTKIIIVCCEGSGVFDGGAGILLALGARLLDVNGEDILTIRGGPEVSRLSSIDMSTIHPKLRTQAENIPIEVVCSNKDLLCGPEGVALANGPQSRASMEQIEALSFALENFAEISGNLLQEDMKYKPGSGVSGLGAGLMLLGAQFRTVSDAQSEYLDLEALFADPWDIIFTGAGVLSFENSKAKKVLEVVQLARKYDIDVIAMNETIGDDIPADLHDRGANTYKDSLHYSGPKEVDIPELFRRVVRRCMRHFRLKRR
ncbi:glycerate kinase [Annulohypoxylon moriforme]|nr:glycerate kinase [Annulohypoxylon moriforme]